MAGARAERPRPDRAWRRRRRPAVELRDRPVHCGSFETERATLDSQLSTLRLEHETLEKQYSSAQGNYVALEKVIDQVSDRLDATIGRLRKVLEG